MKVLLALAVLATSASALAADNREIFDIMYLPNTGTTYGISEFNLINGEAEVFNQDLELSGHRLSQTLGHSFTDRLSLAATLGYQNIETEIDGVNGSSESSGLSDPTLTARFRAMDESFRFDVLGGATLSIMDSELEDNGDSTTATGGSSLFVGSQVGGKSESFQWAVLGQLTHNFEAETDQDSQGDVKEDAHNELVLRLDILNKLAEKSFLRSNVTANFTEGYEDDQSPANETTGQTAYGIGTQYQHLLSTDLLLRAGVDYNKVNDQGLVKDLSFWVLTAGANYEF